VPELGTGDKEQEQTDDADNSGRAEIRFKNDQNAQEADLSKYWSNVSAPGFLPRSPPVVTQKERQAP